MVSSSVEASGHRRTGEQFFTYFARSRRYLPLFCLLVGFSMVVLPRRLDSRLSFQDTRTVTYSIDCVTIGKDPYTQSCDPWGRYFNYPPIWLELRRFGIGSGQTKLAGFVCALLTLASFLYLFRSRSLLNSGVVVLMLVSFPMFFAMRLGNIDQIVFALLVFGMVLSTRLKGGTRDVGRVAVICLLTVLKVFPIAGVVLFLRDRQGWRKALMTVAVSMSALVLTSGHRLPQYLKNTPRNTNNAFGSYTTAKLLWDAVPFGDHTLPYYRRIPLSGTFMAAVAGMLAAYCGIRYRDRLLRLVPRLTAETARGAAAIAGIAIFCFAFVLSSNFDYRLIFLLPAISLVLDDTAFPESKRNLSPIVYIFVAGMLLPWAAFRPERHAGPLVLFISLVHSALFLVCAAWLATFVLPEAAKHLRFPGGDSGAALNVQQHV